MTEPSKEMKEFMTWFTDMRAQISERAYWQGFLEAFLFYAICLALFYFARAA